MMDYHGGLDKYLLKTSDKKLGFGTVLELKRELETRLQEKTDEEKMQMGLMNVTTKRPGFSYKTSVAIDPSWNKRNP